MSEVRTVRSIWPLAAFGIAGGLVLVVLWGVLAFGAQTVPPSGRQVRVTLEASAPGSRSFSPVHDGSVSGGAIPVAVLDSSQLAAVSGPVSATWSSTAGRTVSSLQRDRARAMPTRIALASRAVYQGQYTFLLVHLGTDGRADKLLARAVVEVVP